MHLSDGVAKTALGIVGAQATVAQLTTMAIAQTLSFPDRMVLASCLRSMSASYAAAASERSAEMAADILEMAESYAADIEGEQVNFAAW